MKGANSRRVDVPPENNPCIQVYKLHTILFHFHSSLPQRTVIKVVICKQGRSRNFKSRMTSTKVVGHE